MCYKLLLLSVLLLLCHTKIKAQGIVINEFMASNATSIADQDGDFEDWIELYNTGITTINLKGYWLSDNINQPDRWIFPEVELAPDSFLLIFASGKDRTTGPELHTNFRISIAGEPLLLSDSTGFIIDAIAPVTLTTDNSYGRLPDGANHFVFFDGSTPGSSNNNQDTIPLLNDSIIFTQQQGFYTDSFYLKISNKDSLATIRYTIDGSEPTPQSPVFPDSLLIDDRTIDPNNISTIRTNPKTSPSYYNWKPPDTNVFKAHTLNLQSFYADSTPASPVYTQTYWVHKDIYSRYELPLISIVTDSLHLFDYETGIYVPGLHHDLDPVWHWDWGTGNYHQRGVDWERPARISFFEADGALAFEQNIGLRIHGSGSRALPQKSLRLYARNLYGKNNIPYKFFPDKNVDSYRRIILRNSGQDFYRTMLTDALTHLIAAPMNLEVQSVRPAIVFINGEFWGIHHIRDRMDKYYLNYCCDVNPDAVDILEFDGLIVEGTNTEYLELIDFIENNDLEIDSNYAYVSQFIDIDNYIDYNIAKKFIAVYDWPGNNVKFWRPQQAGAKWRWFFFDNDMSMENSDFNALEHATCEDNNIWPNPEWSTFLLRNFFKNEKFTQSYLERFEYHLLHTFTEARINKLLDTLYYQIKPIMPEQISRWGYPYSYNFWLNTIEDIRKFAAKRPCYMKKHLFDFFNISDSTYADFIDCSAAFIDDKKGSEKTLQIKLFPNPAHNYIQVEFKEVLPESALLKIYDTTGRIVHEKNCKPCDNLKIINLQHFCSGLYLLQVHINDQFYTKKFMIQ